MVDHDDAGDGVDHRLGARRHGGGRRGGRTTSSGSTSSSAARRRSSCSTTPTSRPPSRASPMAGYFNAGQDCTAATRVLAGPGVYGDFVAALDRAAKGTQDRAARRRGRPVRPGQQRRPAGPGRRLRRPGARPRPGRWPAAHRQGDDRLLLRADRRRRPAPGRRDDPGRDLRPGDHRAALHRRGRGRALGQRRASTGWRRACGRRTSAGRCGWPSASTSAACGSTPTSRSSPRCPTAASSTPATARTCRQYGFEDYTRIKHVMTNLDS